MTKFIDAIRNAETTGKKAEKLSFIAGMDDHELELVRLALDSDKQFYVKKWDKPVSFADTDPADHHDFITALNRLSRREVTGNSAKKLASFILSQYTEKSAEVMQRVILKDLRCGANYKTWKKAYPNSGIPAPFAIMLAAKIDEKYQWIFPCQGEAKYDGMRIAAIVEPAPIGVKVTYKSRDGNILDYSTFDDELDFIYGIVKNFDMESGFVLDGEVLANSYQATMKAKGKSGDKESLKFFAFDLIPLDAWNKQEYDVEQLERSEFLAYVISAAQCLRIVKSKSKILNDEVEAQDFYRQILREGENPDGTKNGLGEGLMVKRLDGIYEWERAKTWAKWKPVHTFDLTVVGFYAGEAGKRNANRLGGFTCEGHDENGNFITADVGGGWSDDDRDQLWLIREQVVAEKWVLEIEAQELTKNQNSVNTFSLRFPVAVKWRKDKQV